MTEKLPVVLASMVGEYPVVDVKASNTHSNEYYILCHELDRMSVEYLNEHDYKIESISKTVVRENDTIAVCVAKVKNQ